MHTLRIAPPTTEGKTARRKCRKIKHLTDCKIVQNPFLLWLIDAIDGEHFIR